MDPSSAPPHPKRNIASRRTRPVDDGFETRSELTNSAPDPQESDGSIQSTRSSVDSSVPRRILKGLPDFRIFSLKAKRDKEREEMRARFDDSSSKPAREPVPTWTPFTEAPPPMQAKQKSAESIPSWIFTTNQVTEHDSARPNELTNQSVETNFDESNNWQTTLPLSPIPEINSSKSGSVASPRRDRSKTPSSSLKELFAYFKSNPHVAQASRGSSNSSQTQSRKSSLSQHPRDSSSKASRQEGSLHHEPFEWKKSDTLSTRRPRMDLRSTKSDLERSSGSGMFAMTSPSPVSSSLQTREPSSRKSRQSLRSTGSSQTVIKHKRRFFSDSVDNSPQSPSAPEDQSTSVMSDITTSPIHATTSMNPTSHRATTPPLQKRRGKLRGYFFDFLTPEGSEDSTHQALPAPNLVPTSPKAMQEVYHSDPLSRRVEQATQRVDKQVLPDPEKDWYRVRLASILGDEDELSPTEKRREWDIPDHLPNSPLCPSNPKHPSGGTAVCPTHGRFHIGRSSMSSR